MLRCERRAVAINRLLRRTMTALFNTFALSVFVGDANRLSRSFHVKLAAFGFARQVASGPAGLTPRGEHGRRFDFPAADDDGDDERDRVDAEYVAEVGGHQCPFVLFYLAMDVRWLQRGPSNHFSLPSFKQHRR